MKIIHISDLHFCAPPDAISAYVDKRIVGSFNYFFRRRFQHDFSLLDRAIKFILSENPDVVVCTGDITSTGQPIEFEMALKALESILSSKNIKFLFVPGNHDSYVNNIRCKNSLKSTFAKLNHSVSIKLDDLPSLISIKECDFILINECAPTNIFMSNGRITAESSQKIEDICNQNNSVSDHESQSNQEPRRKQRDIKEASLIDHRRDTSKEWAIKPTCGIKKDKRPKILLGHFPILTKYSFIEKRRGLIGKGKVCELILNKTIDLSLCGHMHKEFSQTDAAGRGELQAASLTKTGVLTVINYNKSDDKFSYKFHSVKNMTLFK